MFDLTSSKLLILGIVALIVVGPKELPGLLRTLGKYVGILRRHANEFRAQFDAAMRESELADLKSEVDGLKRDVVSTLQSAGRSLESGVPAAKSGVENTIGFPGGQPPAPAAVHPAGEPPASAPEPKPPGA